MGWGKVTERARSLATPILIGLLIFGLSQGPPPGSGKHYEEKPNQTASQQGPSKAVPQPPPAPPVVEAPTEEPETDRNDNDRKESRPWWLPTPEWTVALFTVVLAIITFLQWKTLNAGIALTHGMERAYVQLEDIVKTYGGDQTVWTLTFKNTGRTLARISNIIVDYRMLPKGTSLPEIPHYTNNAGWQFIPRDLAPGEAVDTCAAGLPPNERTPFMHGETRLVIYGRLDYTDIFGKPHAVRFGAYCDWHITGQDFTRTPEPAYNQST